MSFSSTGASGMFASQGWMLRPDCCGAPQTLPRKAISSGSSAPSGRVGRSVILLILSRKCCKSEPEPDSWCEVCDGSSHGGASSRGCGRRASLGGSRGICGHRARQAERRLGNSGAGSGARRAAVQLLSLYDASIAPERRRKARVSRSFRRRVRRIDERTCDVGGLSEGLETTSDSTGATNNL